jgi:DNA-binding LacI/PurR family transcriptional regulator
MMEGRMAVTIYDVAERAGVSISTVSNVLNSPARVNVTTRERVLGIIDELGFVPRSEAYARARKGVGRIGVVAPLTTYPSYEVRLRGVLDAIQDLSFEVVIYDQASLTVRSNYLASLPVAKRLDGLIVMSLQFDDAVGQRLLNRELPTVLVEFARRGFSSVHVDDIEGGRLAAEHFAASGHQRCAFVGEARMEPAMEIEAAHRLDGFRAGLAAADIDLPDSYVLRGVYGVDEARRNAHTLFDLPAPPTAVFAHSDVQAVGVLKAIADRGWRCPDDVAVIGFDNLDFADYLGLTTIAQPLRESGRIAAGLLLARINDPTNPTQHVELPLELIRRSTA